MEIKLVNKIIRISLQIYKVPVYGGSGQDQLLNEEELIEQLQECVKGSKNPYPVGILTSDNRNNWGKAHELLLSGNTP